MVGTPLRSVDARPMAHSQEKTPADLHVYAEGTITLGSGVSAQDANRALFIIARASVGGKPVDGPPVAVKKIDAPTFPLSFSLTNANNMMGTEFYPGDLTLLVRLDADGIAGPKQPDDIETSVQIKSKQARQIQVTLQP
jgi:cytochrome c-type biogenesis protein CcmH